jgi:predicted AlkP superfamily phosphohydrolase/phosphomutase
MSDIVERLRDVKYADLCGHCWEAADEIERLREENQFRLDEADRKDAEVELLRTALHETTEAIVHVQKALIHSNHPQDVVMNDALATARRALEGK